MSTVLPLSSERTVLIVEDDDATAELERRALSRRGVAVQVARRASEAIALLGAGKYLAVLLDYQLPDGDPWAVLEAAQAHTPRVPVVLVTAMGSERVAAEAIHRGVADYVAKTATFWEELPATIDRVSRVAQLEETIRRSQSQLAEAQQLAHIGSWEWELGSGGPVVWSDEMYRIYGVEPGSFVPSLEAFLGLVHADDRGLVNAAIERTRRDGTPHVFEHRIVRPDGTVRQILARRRVIADESGNLILRMTGTSEDVTERKELQEQLIFSARMASVGTLAAGVAHEINNPLTYVLSNTEVVLHELPALVERLRRLHGALVQRLGAASSELSGGDAAAEIARDLAALAEPLEDAREGVHRVKHIVRDLRTFARAEDVERQPVQVRRVLESSIGMTWNEIRHRATLVRELDDVPWIEANEARLGQVFLNLLVNAAQSIREGAAEQNEIRVVTRFEPASGEGPGWVVIEVWDTGAGIPPDVLPRIFDPFFTTKPVGEGTGLGLSICRNIVRELGGQIGVESRVGRGTVFRVMLPQAQIEVIEPKLDEALRPARIERGGLRGRIMVVDDEPLILTTLDMVLSDEHEVICFSGATEALARVQAGETFDLILCDLMMPVMTGMDLHQEIAKLSPETAERMVFITGGAFTHRAREFLDRVPNLCLEKPFDVRNLRALVNDRLRGISAA